MNLEHTVCNLCGKDDAEVSFARSDALTGDATEFSVVQCKHCSLVYVDPRPAAQDVGQFYSPEFVSYQFDVVTSENAPLRERLVSLVAKSSAKQRVNTIRKLVNPSPDFRVLDIGCGKGSFLNALHETLGCAVKGIDFDEESARYCRERLSLDVIHGDLSSLDQVGTGYNLVTMWHFLEHEFDPASALIRINKCLNKGEMLVVEVPNVESLENKIFGKRSYLYDIPRHLYNFSPKTISSLLINAGFEPRAITYPYFSGGWMGSVQETLFRGKIYRNLKDNIFLFMLLSQILFPVDYLSAALKRGSIMTIVAKKVDDRSA